MTLLSSLNSMKLYKQIIYDNILKYKKKKKNEYLINNLNYNIFIDK